jgi:parallel beta-helix repeat protein
MGSPDTVIENNHIVNTGTPANAKGIYLLNAPRTIVKDNKIINNSAPGFWAIVVAEDFGDRNNQNKGAGIPEDIMISNNKIINNQNGIKLEAGRNITLEENKIVKTKEIDFLSLLDDADEEEELFGRILSPSDDALVDIERPESNYGILHQELIDNDEADKNYFRYFNIKRNSDGSKGRVGFYKFNFEERQSTERATFSLTGKTGSNTESVKLEVYGILNNDWNERALVWNNAPNLNQNKVEVTGVAETAFHLGTFIIDSPTEKRFTLNVSDFVKQHAGQGEVSFLVVDVEGQNGNVNIYSKEEANSNRWPQLFIETKE